MTSVIHNLITIFNNDPQEPFNYKLMIAEISNTKQIFEKFSEIYKTGLVTLFGQNNKLDIRTLTQKNLEKINKYMLSFGIEVKYKRVTDSEKSQYYKYLLDELVKLDEIKIKDVLDWKIQDIITTELKITTTNKENTLNKIIKIMNNNLTICQMVDFLGLKPEKKINEHCIVYKFEKETHIVSFDFANIGKYQKPVSYIVNHKYMA